MNDEDKNLKGEKMNDEDKKIKVVAAAAVLSSMLYGCSKAVEGQDQLEGGDSPTGVEGQEQLKSADSALPAQHFYVSAANSSEPAAIPFASAVNPFASAENPSASGAASGKTTLPAAHSLEEMVNVLENANTDGNQALLELKQYLELKKDLHSGLSKAYKDNQEIASLCSTLIKELKGAKAYQVDPMVSPIGDAVLKADDFVNNLKPNFMNDIDDGIINLFGMNPEEAKAKHEKIKQIYDNAENYHDMQLEYADAVKAFTGYLKQTKEDALKENKEIEGVFHEMLNNATKVYRAEGRVMDSYNSARAKAHGVASPGQINPSNVGLQATDNTEYKTIPMVKQQSFIPTDATPVQYIAGTGGFILAAVGVLMWHKARTAFASSKFKDMATSMYQRMK